jgi:copper chaperone CopZ
VQSALTELEHVKEADVSLQTGNAIVHYRKNQVTLKQMKQAISRAGFSVTGHSIPRESDKEFSLEDSEEHG